MTVMMSPVNTRNLTDTYGSVYGLHTTVKWVIFTRANFCETLDFCLRRKFCSLKVHDLSLSHLSYDFVPGRFFGFCFVNSRVIKQKRNRNESI